MRFYVNGTTGSDTLDSGRGESASLPFQTLQACINYVTDNFNISRYVATIYCADVVTTEQIILPKFNATSGNIVIRKWSVSESDYGVTINCKPTGTIFAVLCTGGIWYLRDFDINISNENYTSGSGHWGGVDVDGLDAELRLHDNIKVYATITKSATFAGAHAIHSSNGLLSINSSVEIAGSLAQGSSIRLNALSVGQTGSLRYDNGDVNLKISGNFYRIMDCSGKFNINGVFRDDIDTTEITDTTYKYYVTNGGQCNTGGKGPDYFGTIGTGYVEESTYSWYK